ncbi:Arginyl-tRNA--protein transferase 1, partial [Coemansia sp. RSA 2559]
MMAAPPKLGEKTPAAIDGGIGHEDDSGSGYSSSESSNESSSEDELLEFLGSSQPRSCIRVYGMLKRSKCGYCNVTGGSSYLGAHAYQLTCDDYQALIDRGWRRSGTFLYLTDHKDSCCA